MVDFLSVSGMICLSFRDRFDILLEKRLAGVAELMQEMLSWKSQVQGYFMVTRRERLDSRRAKQKKTRNANAPRKTKERARKAAQAAQAAEAAGGSD